MEIVHSNYLHVVPTSSSAGALKLVLPKGTSIAFMHLDIETGMLPDDLSEESYLKCKEHELWDVGDGNSYMIFGAGLSKYNGIIVWHSKDVRSMLLLSMMCALYDGEILTCNVSPKFPNAMVGNLSPFQLKECIADIEPIKNRMRASLSKKYFSIPHYPCVKKYFNGNFSIISSESLKKRLLRNASHRPLAWHQIVGKTIGKSPTSSFYSSFFWDSMLLDLVCEGRLIISEMVMKKTDINQYPIGILLTRPYIVNGFDLRKLYSFKCFKPSLRNSLAIKKLPLTEFQIMILSILYKMNALSVCHKFVSTDKVVMAYYADYSSTAKGKPIKDVIDSIYSMAQPWRIKMPFIIARGNIGTPDMCDYDYSGAADMFYTEVALSDYGKNIIENYLNSNDE